MKAILLISIIGRTRYSKIKKANSDEFEGNYDKKYLHEVVDGKYS